MIMHVGSDEEQFYMYELDPYEILVINYRTYPIWIENIHRSISHSDLQCILLFIASLQYNY